MADYFTNFSVVLPLTKEQQDYAVDLAKQVDQHRGNDEPLPKDFPPNLIDETEDWTFETEATPEGLWLRSQYGGQESACTFIQHLLQKYNFAPFVGFEWSHDCSKPCVDAYGGGAAIITAKEIKTMHTSDWVNANSPPQQNHLFSVTTQLCIRCGISADDDLIENGPCIQN